MKKASVLLPGILFVAGCMSSYQLPPQANRAEFYAVGQNPLSGATSRSLVVHAYSNEECALHPFGAVVVKTFQSGSPSEITTNDTYISTDEPFHFRASFGESRFGQQGNCQIEATFQAQAKRKYKAQITVKESWARCGIQIFDVTTGQDVPVEFDFPAMTCANKTQPASLNGGGGNVLWRIEVK